MREQLWKVAVVLVSLGAALVSHLDQLPPPLQPYRAWFEFGGLICGLTQAIWIRLPQRPWTEAERAAYLAKQASGQ